MFQTNVEKIKTHILFSLTVFLKSCLLRDNVEKYFRAGQATYDNMAHAHCILDTQDYTHAHSEYVTLIPFTLQQWLQEGTSTLRYTYIACLVACSQNEVSNFYIYYLLLSVDQK
jgi:hypothetical protein